MHSYSHPKAGRTNSVNFGITQRQKKLAGGYRRGRNGGFASAAAWGNHPALRILDLKK